MVTATWGLGVSYSALGNNALKINSRMIKYSAYACVWNTLYRDFACSYYGALARVETSQ